MFTIFYAVIGIPLFLLYLSNIGQIFATSFKWTYSRLCKCQILTRHRRFRLQDKTLKYDFPMFRKYRIENIPSHIHPGLLELQKSDQTKASLFTVYSTVLYIVQLVQKKAKRAVTPYLSRTLHLDLGVYLRQVWAALFVLRTRRTRRRRRISRRTSRSPSAACLCQYL